MNNSMSIPEVVAFVVIACFIVYMICQLIDSERQRQQVKKDERRDKRIVFEHEMELIREEREEQGDYHWGEVRVKVRRGRRAA
jgi:large-conductance mechanosensitive channel